jgi:hypothetical protein
MEFVTHVEYHRSTPVDLNVHVQELCNNPDVSCRLDLRLAICNDGLRYRFPLRWAMDDA